MVVRRINQSMIKDVGHEEACPMRFRLYYLDKKYRNAPSAAMIKGQYFEMRTLGTIAQDGTVPEIPLLQNGEKSAAHRRIDEQIENFKKMIEEQQLTIKETNIKLEADLTIFDGRTVTLFGTLDAVLENFFEEEITDTKLTSDVTSTWGPYSWGNWDIMDKLQAYTYSYLYRENRNKECDFAFHVYDYKPVPEYREFRVLYDEANFEALRHRVDETVLKIEQMEAEDFIPQPHVDECKMCLAEDCPLRACAPKVKMDENFKA